MKKLERRELPKGHSCDEFIYQGRPSKGQDDFGSDVGLADLACVDQFGASNTNKFYHAGIVKNNSNQWYVYLEWGRVFSGKSWQSGSHFGQDYQFVECINEQEARDFFQKQCRSKNIKRLIEKDIAGKKIWVAKGKEDGYVVQSLAMREKGLPDAYLIKEGIADLSNSSKKKEKKLTKSNTKKFQKEVIDLAFDLLGGTKNYVRAASASTGIIPTLDAIKEVRDNLLVAAMQRLSVVGNDIDNQLKDKDLIDLSNVVASLVPRPISRGGTKQQRMESTILSSDNILSIQQDLDAYESSLSNADFDEKEIESDDVDPFKMLNANVEWIDLNSTKGRWIEATFRAMDSNRSSNFRSVKIKNIFEIKRDKLDKEAKNYSYNIAEKYIKNPYFKDKAKLQQQRIDLDLDQKIYEAANMFLGFHGSRAVNIGPIIQTNLRLPKSLSGVIINGANFGGGIYFASSKSKALNYASNANSYWAKDGAIKNRGSFVFMADVVMGDAYMATGTGSWDRPPNSKDSIAAFPEYCRTLLNDEHIVFDKNAFRLRYLIEIE